MWVVASLILMAVLALYVHVNYFILLISTLTFKEKQKRQISKFPFVSAIIATKNEESVIEETLRNLKKSNYPGKMEIVVVDSSNDNTPIIARKYGARIIKDKAGKGKPNALNLAVRKAKGEVLYFLDADSWVEKDTIKNLVSKLSPEYPAYNGIVLQRNKNTMVARVARLHMIFLLFTFQTWLNRFAKTNIASGKNFAIYKSELLKIGGFENVLTEDINLTMRLYKNGKKVGFSTDAVIREGVPQKLEYYWKQQERWYGGGAAEIRKIYNKTTLYESFILMPMIFFLLASHIVSLFLSVVFLFTGNYILLAAAIFVFCSVVYAALRFLDKDEIALIPITYVLLVIFQLSLSTNLIIKKILGKKIEWYKTPKEGL